MAEVAEVVVISQFGIDTNLMGSAWRPALLSLSLSLSLSLIEKRSSHSNKCCI